MLQASGVQWVPETCWGFGGSRRWRRHGGRGKACGLGVTVDTRDLVAAGSHYLIAFAQANFVKSQWAVKTLEGWCEVRGGRRKRGGALAQSWRCTSQLFQHMPPQAALCSG